MVGIQIVHVTIEIDIDLSISEVSIPVFSGVFEGRYQLLQLLQSNNEDLVVGGAMVTLELRHSRHGLPERSCKTDRYDRYL